MRRSTKFRWRLRTLLLIIALGAAVLALDVRRRKEICPMDLIDVEVPAAPPGHPITRERLVRPDGSITLGYYGDVEGVAGLTPSEAKAKIVIHLRRYLSDEALGLVERSWDSDRRRWIMQTASADETNRVTLWVIAKNSSAAMIDRIAAGIRRCL